MFSFRSGKVHVFREVLNLTFVRPDRLSRHIQVCPVRFKDRHEEKENEVNRLMQKYKDKVLYSGYIESKKLKLGYKLNTAARQKRGKEAQGKLLILQRDEPIPLSLKYLLPDDKNNEVNRVDRTEKYVPVHLPFQNTDCDNVSPTIDRNETKPDDDVASITDIEIKTRLRLLKENPINWMTAYENYDDEISKDDDWKINYGTPDSSSAVSNVPCGGCGALLHCKDTSIPGYIPSEIYKNYHNKRVADLKQLICQRCHFLNTYNLALQVRVSSDDYPMVLQTIRDRERALVILMIDLLDFPCSIWPGIADLLGRGRPIFVVGNKVDLLPQDGRGFLERIRKALESSLREAGFAAIDIEHIALTSAKTGFGVEDLVTKLFSSWKYKGDVFLVGCTNVGKSSLFNALLQSDYCKAQAADLIQRATTSPWPGTTLNLLKFPITRPTGSKLYVRHKRLESVRRLIAQERKLQRSQLNSTKDVAKYATIMGHIDRTFYAEEPVRETDDPFAVQGHANAVGRVKFGIDDKDKQYVLNKWCYDTPGVVQPDQIIHLLTTDELMLTLPKELLRPQTFTLRPGTTIFIAALARLDYINGENSARFTVFCSSALPITVCETDVADDVYKDFVGTDLFAVPINNPDRLELWPGLTRARDYTVKGVDRNYSCADVVLSSAGWIAVTCERDVECQLRAWSPEKRGVHIRESLLPEAVSLRGKKIRDSPAYSTGRFYAKN